MDFFSIILLAVGLAMDCLAVSVSKGICAGRFRWRDALRMACLFGLFQGLMPLAGYAVSSLFAAQIKAVDHWVAFGLLGFIGGRMIVEAYKPSDGACAEAGGDRAGRHYAWGSLLVLAVATSIDALATGVIFAPYPEWIAVAVLIIGVTSFLLSLVGTAIGTAFGNRFHLKVEVWGGVILILIGAKILVEHLFFS